MNIDWGLAERVAGAVSGSPNGEVARPLPGELEAMADAAQTGVVAYTRLEPASRLPPPEEVDRGVWSAANLQTMRGTLDPLVAKAQPGPGPLAGPMGQAAGVLLGAEIGGLTGFMSRRVLGQSPVDVHAALRPWPVMTFGSARARARPAPQRAPRAPPRCAPRPPASAARGPVGRPGAPGRR